MVISDVRMPGTSGLDLARILHARGVPLILTTAFPSLEVERQAAAQRRGASCASPSIRPR